MVHPLPLMRNLFPAILLMLSATFAAAQSPPSIRVVPMPASVELGSGRLPIDRSFSVSVTGYHDVSLDRGIQRFLSQLSRQTAIPFWTKTGSAKATLVIHTARGRERVQKLGEDESYTLLITSARAELDAPTPLGTLHGLETFLQLVEPSADGFTVPVVTIHDQPRFPWRGLLIDVSRHFMPLDALRRNLDAMAAVKMNVLHWHLSDDQGFRVESRRFPRLHGMGSEGQFYTQAEIREFIAYARDRGIRVVPEFDVPGHSRSWFLGYPELASGPGPYALDGNASPAMDPTRESTYRFLDKFVGEMSGLFPDAYFHIGGDEVDGKQWDANPKIQKFMRAHRMERNQDLQAGFNRRLQKILSKHHKQMIGWDEILHPDLLKTIVVQSWRGQQSLASAAKQGYPGLLSHGYYLDLMWPAARHYAVDPMSDAAADLTPEQKSHILGGESCMWVEWVSPENIDNRIWPRNAAVAERLWSPQSVTDPDSLYARLDALTLRLEFSGLTLRSSRTLMLRRMAGAEDVAALAALADVLEPVKGYARSKGLAQWDFHAPLNRMVDAVYPESDAARRFTAIVQAWLAGGHTDSAAEAQIRAQLTAWRDLDAKLHPLLADRALLQELAPISSNLSALSAAGLQALDHLDHAQPSPDDWRAQQLALATQAQQPSANLLLMVAAPIQQLLDATAH